jgi:hypothetical protein
MPPRPQLFHVHGMARDVFKELLGILGALLVVAAEVALAVALVGSMLAMSSTSELTQRELKKWPCAF